MGGKQALRKEWGGAGRVLKGTGKIGGQVGSTVGWKGASGVHSRDQGDWGNQGTKWHPQGGLVGQVGSVRVRGADGIHGGWWGSGRDWGTCRFCRGEFGGVSSTPQDQRLFFALVFPPTLEEQLPILPLQVNLPQ